MAKSAMVAVVALALAASLVAPSEVAAQERVVVEERTAEVVRISGRTVVIRNDLGELKMYTELPEDVRLYIAGEPAEIEDLEEGMLLYGVRWENVPAPVPVTRSRAAPPARQRRPARIVPYRHADEELDSAMRFVAETVTEEPRWGSASFQVWIPAACTLRFDQLNAGGWRVPVHLVNLTHVAPDQFRYRDTLMCLETTSLENRFVYYELPVDQDGSYPLERNVPARSRLAKDRFCFRVAGGYSYRVWRALAAAVETCGGRTEW